MKQVLKAFHISPLSLGKKVSLYTAPLARKPVRHRSVLFNFRVIFGPILFPSSSIFENTVISIVPAVCMMFVTKQLMTGPEGNKIFIVSRGTNLEGSVICYIARNFEAGNSLNLATLAVVGQHSWITLHCYPLTSWIFLQCCPLRDFGGKQFHC